LAAERRESPYHYLAFTIATCWLSLAREQEAIAELVANGGKNRSTAYTASNRSTS
jgi:hypothetical protein